MIIPQRNHPPEIKLSDKVRFLKPEKRTLDNGLPAYFIKGGTQNIVKVEMVFTVGSYHQQKPLQTFLTANLMKNGSQSKSSLQMSELLDFYGISLQVEAQKDIISVALFCLTKYLEPALSLLMEILAQPSFPEDEFQIMLKDHKQKHIVNLQKVQHLARAHFAGLIFGDEHPYGKRLKVSHFDEISLADIKNYYSQHLHPGNCICIVAGQYPENMTELINKNVERLGWQAQKPVDVKQMTPLVAAQRQHFIKREDALQSSIRLGKLIVNREHPDFHKISITNTMLGGYFGSRLMANIRQDKGYTYGIHSAVVSLLRSSYFFIASQVGKTVCHKALEEIYRELGEMRNKPAGNDELTMLKNYLSAGFLRSFDGPFMQAERFKEILLFGLDYSHYENYIDTLKDITARDIQHTAGKYFHEKDMIELIAG